MPHLVFGEWNKSPVRRPGVLENRLDDFQILTESRSAQRPDEHRTGGFVQNGFHELGRNKIGRDTIRQQVLDTPVSLGCELISVVRAGVAHHDHRRRIVTVYEEPALLVDRKIERPADSRHALLTQPDFSRAQESVKGLRVVFGLEEPEESDGIVIALLV